MKAENSVISYFFFYETKEANIRLCKSVCFGNIIKDLMGRKPDHCPKEQEKVFTFCHF